MVKAILLGTQGQLHQIGNRFLPGGVVVDITEEEAQKHSDVVTYFGDTIIEAKKEQPQEKKKVKKVTK